MTSTNAATSAALPAAEPDLSPAQARLLAGLLIGVLVAGLDSTIVATIMPRMLAEFESIHYAPWIFAAYMLAQTASAPIFGKLTDQFGRKRIFLIGLALFLGGSELAAFSRSLEQLIACRALQGIGAGALFPSALATVFLAFPERMHARLQGLFSAMYGIANVLGPLLGIAVASRFGWRSAFYINLPIAAASGWLVWRHFEDLPPKETNAQVDYLGATILVAAVLAFSVGVMGVGGEVTAFSRDLALALLAVSLVLVAVFGWAELRAPSPILPMPFLRAKLRVAGGSLLTGMMMYSAIFFVPMFVRAVIGGSAALALVPLTLASVAGSMMCGRLVGRFGLRGTGLRGATVAIVGFALASTMGPRTPLVAAMAIMTVIGAGVGVLLVTMVLSMRANAPDRFVGVSSSMSQFFRNMGGLLAVNALSAVQTYRFFHATSSWPVEATQAVRRLGGMKEIGSALFARDGAISEAAAAVIRGSYADATTVLFAVGALFAIMTLAMCLDLPAQSTLGHNSGISGDRG